MLDNYLQHLRYSVGELLINNTVEDLVSNVTRYTVPIYPAHISFTESRHATAAQASPASVLVTQIQYAGYTVRHSILIKQLLWL